MIFLVFCLAPKSSPPPPSNEIETTNNEDPVEATVEISVTDRKLTILSTASIPFKRAARNPFVSVTKKTAPKVYTLLADDDDDDIQELQPISVPQERKVHTITPRRRQHPPPSTNSETVFNIYKQRIISHDLSTAAKRPSPDIECTKSKKLKETPEIVILD